MRVLLVEDEPYMAEAIRDGLRLEATALRKRLGEPWIIATVSGAGYRIDTVRDTRTAKDQHG